jgi:hypothetical protein
MSRMAGYFMQYLQRTWDVHSVAAPISKVAMVPPAMPKTANEEGKARMARTTYSVRRSSPACTLHVSSRQHEPRTPTTGHWTGAHQVKRFSSIWTVPSHSESLSPSTCTASTSSTFCLLSRLSFVRLGVELVLTVGDDDILREL